MELTKEQALQLYEQMRLIRTFEDRVAQLFADGEIPGFVHLYAGEEAVAVGVMANLRNDDWITSTHRGHGHCIAKGVDLNGMAAELFGKETGVCHGKGGSMHIADVTKGMLGANGIVGGGPPMAVGAGLTAKTLGTDQVCVCFFGDGAAEQGTTHEGMNLASVWKLPVVFVCENNGFAESTPVGYHGAVPDIAERAAAYNMPSVSVDGLDVTAVLEAAEAAVARARAGAGPSLIECKTWRYYGHFEGDQITYRTSEMNAEYRAKDAILRFAKLIVDRGVVTDDELKAVDIRCEHAMAEAVEFARSSPSPPTEACLSDVYVSYAAPAAR